MDVKGARALSERLAEAARNADPPDSKAVDSGDDRASESGGSTAQNFPVAALAKVQPVH